MQFLNVTVFKGSIPWEHALNLPRYTTPRTPEKSERGRRVIPRVGEAPLECIPSHNLELSMSVAGGYTRHLRARRCGLVAGFSACRRGGAGRDIYHFESSGDV